MTSILARDETYLLGVVQSSFSREYKHKSLQVLLPGDRSSSRKRVRFSKFVVDLDLDLDLAVGAVSLEVKRDGYNNERQ